ncbi:MAG: AAA family ATPase [Bacteriovoracaceae bacterium]|nr:AAA family ATPase [Bacteriovoracaceae bacterium]
MRFLIIFILVIHSLHAQEQPKVNLPKEKSFSEFPIVKAVKKFFSPRNNPNDAEFSDKDMSSLFGYRVGDTEVHQGTLEVMTNMGSGLSVLVWRSKQQSDAFSKNELSPPQMISATTYETHSSMHILKPDTIKIEGSSAVKPGEVNLIEMYNRYYIFFHKTGRFHKLDYVVEEADKPSERQPRIKEMQVHAVENADNSTEYLIKFKAKEASVLDERVYLFSPGQQKYFKFDDLKQVGHITDYTSATLAQKANSENRIIYQRTLHFPKFSRDGKNIKFEGYEEITKGAAGMQFMPTQYKVESLSDIHKAAADIEEKLNERFVEREAEIHALMEQVRQVWKGGRDQTTNSTKKNRFVIFLGATGTAKTDLGEALADVAYEGRKIKIELNDLTSENDANAITGAREGYKDHEKPTPWEEYKTKYGDRPGVIILDKMDMGDPSIQGLFSKLLSKGKITIKGKELDFSNCVVIGTTTKGANKAYPVGRTYTKVQIEERRKIFNDAKGRELLKQKDSAGPKNAKNAISPDLIGLADSVIVFPPLSTEGAEKIVEKEIKQICEQLKINEQMDIEVDPSLVPTIVKENYRIEDGAWKIKSLAQQLVESSIDKAIEKLGVDSGDDLKVKYIVKGEDELVEITNKSTGKSELFPAPKANVGRTNPLLNPEYAFKLENIGPEMKKKIFEQDQAIDAIAKEMKARAMNPDIQRATSVILMGTTGTGKTEITKVLAEVVYGDPERVGRIDMSAITDEDRARVLFFGDPRNPDYISEFHQILMDYPDGCIINLDELGNVGYRNANGQNPAKTGITQKLYPVFDERYITLPNGKKADLKNYIIVGTTNDGQEQFKNAPSDDERKAIYEEINKRQVANQILLQSGFSEPLVARVDIIVIMGPATQKSRELTLNKFLKNTEKTFIEAHKIKGFKISEETNRIAAEIFYSHEEGARKLRRFGESAISADVGTALLDMKKFGPINGAEVEISVSDSYYNKWYFEGDRPEKRKVTLTLKVTLSDGQSKTFESNVLDNADKHTLVNRDEITLVAFHEAGHAIMNAEELTGQSLRTITVRSKGDYLGYAGFKPTDAKHMTSRQDIVARLGRVLGGREAEIMFARNYLGISAETAIEEIISDGASQDLRMAHDLAVKAIAGGGLTEKSLDLPLDKEGNVKVDDPITMQEISRLLKDGEKYAREMVNHQTNKEVIEKIALRLIDIGMIQGDEVRDFAKSVHHIHKKVCNGHFQALQNKINARN